MKLGKKKRKCYEIIGSPRSSPLSSHNQQPAGGSSKPAWKKGPYTRTPFVAYGDLVRRLIALEEKVDELKWGPESKGKG